MVQKHEDIQKIKEEAKQNEGKIIILNPEKDKQTKKRDDDFCDYEEIKD